MYRQFCYSTPPDLLKHNKLLKVLGIKDTYMYVCTCMYMYVHVHTCSYLYMYLPKWHHVNVLCKPLFK